MVVLDTDHLTFLEWPDHPIGQALIHRLNTMQRDDVATTIISFEEQTRGWLAAIRRAKNVKEQIDRYRELRRMVQLYCSINILDFDEQSAMEFQQLRKNKTRLGTMDLRIASIALATQATLLTRNLSDFIKVPGLKIEDWTRPKE